MVVKIKLSSPAYKTPMNIGAFPLVNKEKGAVIPS